MRKFGSNVDFRKVDFLSAEKISRRSRFLTNVNNENMMILSRCYYKTSRNEHWLFVIVGILMKQFFYE